MNEQGLYVSAKDELRIKLLQEYLSGKLTRKNTGSLLKVCERTITRMASDFNKSGILGIVHKNRGNRPHNKIDEEVRKDVMNLVKKKYYDFNMTHCLEVLEANHGIKVPYHPFRKWCHEEKLVKRKRKRRRTNNRNYRDRMSSSGYLIQFDGSPEKYNGRDDWCLISGIDDATSEIPYAEFFPAETTLGCMKVIKNLIRKKGIPIAIYTDKAGWSGGQKRTDFSQFKRACEELGITVIFADSPEAKGRVERSFQTIQDRIIPELRMHKIKRMEKANEYLQKVFLPKYWNKKNTVPARDPEDAYRKLKKGRDLENIFCIKIDRAIGKDKVFQYKNEYFLIRSELEAPIYYRTYIVLHVYENGTWAAFFRGRKVKVKKIINHTRHLKRTNEEPSSEQFEAMMNEELGLTKRKHQEIVRIQCPR
jgi:transposase